MDAAVDELLAVAVVAAVEPDTVVGTVWAAVDVDVVAADVDDGDVTCCVVVPHIPQKFEQ